jgi:hypothetical protein
MKGRTRTTVLLFGVFLAIAPRAGWARDAAGRVITTWNGGCSGSTRGWWDNMIRDWYEAISNATPVFGHGAQAYGRVGLQVDGTIEDGDFTDAGVVSFGNDHTGPRPDGVDAFMLGLHGLEIGGLFQTPRWAGRVRVDEPGAGNCNAFQGHMRFGNSDCEFLHLSSCYSLNKDDWSPHWGLSFEGVHQIDGFHGIMWIGQDLVDDYGDFANDAFWTGVSSAWIDNLYAPDVSQSYDQCPVAENVGINSADAVLRMSLERYNNVFPDPPGSGEPRRFRVRYVAGCDPKGKGAL